jgi:hypothetical protein
MEQGIICIGVDEARSGGDTANPYRDGNWCVITEEGMRRIISEPMASQVAKKRVCFIESEAWNAAGLPSQRSKSGAKHFGPKVVPDE